MPRKKDRCFYNISHWERSDGEQRFRVSLKVPRQAVIDPKDWTVDELGRALWMAEACFGRIPPKTPVITSTYIVWSNM